MGLEAYVSPCVKAAYRVLTTAATPILAVHLLVRQVMGKESSTRLRERWGHATRARPAGRLVWLHAASLGEGAAALPLIVKILEEMPRANILVTGGSVAADEWRRRKFPEQVIRQFIPVDTPAAVSRFVSHWKPDVGIFVESELWPNLIERSSANGVRLALVNARLSAASAKTWKMPVVNCVFKDTVRRFHMISTQNQAERERFISLGATRAQMTTSADLKLVSAAKSRDDATRTTSLLRAVPENVSHSENGTGEIVGRRSRRASLTQRLDWIRNCKTSWLAASTHDGEEVACARIHIKLRERFPTLLTCIVPRHAERAPGIREALRGLGLGVRCFSEGEPPEPGADVFLVDAVGVLPEVYAASRGKPAFIGGSLFRGSRGHNVAEATLAGCAVIVGAHHETFKSMVDDINEQRMVCEVVTCERELLDAVQTRLDDVIAAATLGDAGMMRTRTLLSGVLERLWSSLSVQLFQM